ncbi:restriction endonuclease subunit S [uncultured Lactobacillus sp.]|uniref:restriction endonuclease subunit S n=1 Tax=uncultured Lactobacillus sp. TaxID=153152 RepID=UPI0026663F31|nr:restriction endonuclease subunit S [uncultured Lactobacillus sp.]
MELLEYADRWDAHRLGSLFQEQKEKNTDFTRRNALKFTYGSIVDKPEYDMTPSLIDTYSKYKLVNAGDIIINCLNLNYDFVSQRVAIVKNDGIITSAYISLRARNDEINPMYYCYYFKAMDSRKMFHGMGTGIRLTLSYNELRNVPIPVPPRAEQDQIVRFLDWKVSEINKKVALKKRSLDLIKELINSAIAALTNYGSETVRLKRVASLENDYIDINPEESYRKAGMYNRGRGIFLREAISGKEMGDSRFQRIHSGRLMLSGQFAWEDAVFVTSSKDEEGVASHRYYLLKSENKDVPVEYLFGYFISQKGFTDLQQCSHGSAGRNRPLNINELLRIEIPIVHDHEALRKLCCLVQDYMTMRPLVLREERILDELRNCIISDVVTGKIDVRNVTVPEYERVDDAADDDSEEDEAETTMDEEV